MNTFESESPVIVTGTGGSGTRVMAEILEVIGGFMGANQNLPKDNMDSAFFLTGNIDDVQMFFKTGNNRQYYRKKISMFAKSYFMKKLSIADYLFIFRIFLSYLKPDLCWTIFTTPKKERLSTSLKLLRLKQLDFNPINFKFWGFKDPDAVYILDALLDAYPNLRLIHMIRDGRDMALSTQEKPYLFYSRIFDINDTYNPKSAYEFWRRFNEWTYNFATSNINKNNVLFIRFEDLCYKPHDTIRKVCSFLNILIDDNSDAFKIPRVIPSIGRWKAKAAEFTEINSSILEKFDYV